MSDISSTSSKEVSPGSFYDPVAAFPLVKPRWDRPSIVGEVMLSSSSAGSEGEWRVVFYDFDRFDRLKDPSPPALRIEAFGDGLAALHASGLVELLVERGIKDMSQEDFVALLLAEGWHDRTAELRGDQPLRCVECHGTGWADDKRPADG